MQEVRKYPDWKELLEVLGKKDHGELITFHDMNSLLIEGDIREDKRHVFEKFQKELLKQHNKALENVMNQGYRIIFPKEHVRAARDKVTKAKRQIMRGQFVMAYTDTNGLTEEEKERLNKAQIKTGQLQGIVSFHEKQLSKLSIAPYKVPELPKPKKED